MSDTDSKKDIQSAITAFSTGSLFDNTMALFHTLGYNTNRQNPLSQNTYTCFKDTFIPSDCRFNEDKALANTDWKSIDLQFQLTTEELSDDLFQFTNKKVNNRDIQSYLFIAVELLKSEYARTALAQITREINKVLPCQ